MFRNVTMLIPLMAGVLALVIADSGRDYFVAGAFIVGSFVVWCVWRLVDGAVTKEQRSSLDNP